MTCHGHGSQISWCKVLTIQMHCVLYNIVGIRMCWPGQPGIGVADLEPMAVAIERRAERHRCQGASELYMDDIVQRVRAVQSGHVTNEGGMQQR
jgi:hypothetical protein